MSSVVTSASVEAGRSGRVVVRWELAGPDHGVLVALGGRPDLVDHTAALHVAAGQRSVELKRPAVTHVYAAVSPSARGSGLLAAERRVILEGATNFRDLGGYATVEGRHTRWGRVFRSDAFHALTDDDVDRLADLGISVVYDLRSKQERNPQPNVFTADGHPRSVQLPLGSGADEHCGLPPVEVLRAGTGFIVDLYRGMLEHSATTFGALLSGLAEPDALPAVFHCMWGKDRTGVAAALLLSALGVAQEDVVVDYGLTERFRRAPDIEATLARLCAAGVPARPPPGSLRRRSG
jgi:protein-tyrosine phosphatase